MKKVVFVILIMITGGAASAQSLSKHDAHFYFFKMWNYVKYYHPALATGQTNADTLFLKNIGEVDAISTKEGFNVFAAQFLGQLPPANTKAVYSRPQKILLDNLDRRWLTKSRLLTADNKSRLTAIFDHRHTGKIHYYIPDINFSAEIPHEGTYAFPDSINLPYNLRMLALAKIQGMADYLFPHRYLMDEDFDVVVKRQLPLFANCRSRAEYEKLLLATVSSFNDSHAFAFVSQIKNKQAVFNNSYYPPFEYSVFDDQVVITNIILPDVCSRAGIARGDIIKTINGTKVSTLVNHRATLLSVSNRPTLRYWLSDYRKNLLWQSDTGNFTFTLKGQKGSKVVPFIRNTDAAGVKRITDYIVAKMPEERTGTALDMVTDDIVRFKIREGARFTYIEEDKIESTIDSLLTVAAGKKGIIFDMRNYPDWPGLVFTYVYKKFGHEPNHYADYYQVNKAEVGTFVRNEEPETYNLDVNPEGLDYKGRVVIIVNPATLSLSEWNTMDLQNIFPGSITIGEQSAGADGDEKKLMLPGGYQMNFTGNAILYPNGTPAQRKGVKIDKFMPLTPQNVLSPDDYLLEEAIKIIRG